MLKIIIFSILCFATSLQSADSLYIDFARLDLNKIQINEQFFSKSRFHIVPENHNDSVLIINTGNVRTNEGIIIFSMDVSNYSITLDSLTTIAWRWKIKDTRFSDGISLRIMFKESLGLQFFSHSRYTFGTVLFCNEKSSIWGEHKINLYKTFKTYLDKQNLTKTQIVRIDFLTMESYNQELWLDYLTITRKSARHADAVHNYQIGKKNENDMLIRKTESVCLCDIDRDNDPDLFLVNQLYHNIIRINDGSGQFREEILPYDYPQWNRNNHAVFVDVNNDGWLDLYEGRENTENIIFLNRGSFKFDPDTNALSKNNFIANSYASLWADFNYDEKIDFIDVYPNSVDAGFSGFRLMRIEKNIFHPIRLEKEIPFFGGSACDFDNDNLFEIFMAHINGQNRMFKLNMKDPFEEIDHAVFRDLPFPDRTNNKYKGYGRTEGGVFADFNHDGFSDLYVCNDGDPNQMFIWDGEKFTEEAIFRNTADSLKSEGFLIADFDNDMDWDIYILHTFTQNQLLLNDGNGYFYDGTAGSGFEDPGGAMGAACGDIDNDGDIDICLADPYREIRVLYNPVNDKNFIKVKLRGQPGNYYGIRAKISIFNQDNNDLICFHQTTCGDGFQFEPFAQRFHFGAQSGYPYKIQVKFSDGRVAEKRFIKAGTTTTLIYPHDNMLFRFFNLFLYKVHEPVLRTLRAHYVVYSLIILLLSGLLINVLKHQLFLKNHYQYIIAALFILSVFLFFYDLKNLSVSAIAVILIPSAYLSEIIINPARKYLRYRFTREHSWDHLFEYLKAFRHGGVAINNLDRLVFLYQNLSDFEGDFEQYHKRIQDAVHVFYNQTSWQLTELSYLLKDMHFDHKTIQNIRTNQKRLNRALINSIKSNDKNKIIVKSEYIITKINFLESEVDRIYRNILPHFICDPVYIAKQVINPNYKDYDIQINNTIAGKKFVLIKGFELGNIISDLIRNGINASKNKRYKGSLTFQEDDLYVTIDVKDNGPGIPENIQQRIFTKGFSTKKEGGGFGLYYARERLNNYSGNISIHKTGKNTGTVIRLVLKKVKNRKPE